MAATDPKHGYKDNNLLAPALQFAAITTGDTSAADFSFGLTRGVYVGGAGNIVAVDKDGNAVTFNGATAGSILPIRVMRINATNTTATNLVALY